MSRFNKILLIAILFIVLIVTAVFLISAVPLLLDMDVTEYWKFILYIVIGLFVSLYSLCVELPLLGYIECTMCLALISLFLMVRYSEYHPIIRSLFNTLLSVLPIFAITSRIYLLSSDIDGVAVDCAITSIILLVCYVVFQISNKEKFFFIVPKADYVLYLRRFSTEERGKINVEIESNIQSNQLLRIGDPSTDDGGRISFSGYTFFLPLKDWKPIVEYYISRAKLVLCRIDTSDGVIWEMFEHKNNKTIYCIDGGVNLQQAIERYEDKGYKNTELYCCLNEISRLVSDRPIYVYINEAQCVYSYALNDVLKYIKEDCSACVNSFTMPYVSNDSTIKVRKPFYIVVDVFRYLFVVIRPYIIKSKLTSALAVILWLFSLLLGAYLIYSGVLVGVSIFVPQIEGSVLDFGNILVGLDNQILPRLILCAFTIWMGCAFIKSSK